MHINNNQSIITKKEGKYKEIKKRIKKKENKLIKNELKRREIDYKRRIITPRISRRYLT